MTGNFIVIMSEAKDLSVGNLRSTEILRFAQDDENYRRNP